MTNFYVEITRLHQSAVEGTLYSHSGRIKYTLGSLHMNYEEMSDLIIRLAAIAYTNIKGKDAKLLKKLKFQKYPLPVFDGDGDEAKSIRITQLNDERSRNKKSSKKSKGKNLTEEK